MTIANKKYYLDNKLKIEELHRKVSPIQNLKTLKTKYPEIYLELEALSNQVNVDLKNIKKEISKANNYLNSKQVSLYYNIYNYESGIDFLISCGRLKEQEVRNLYPRVFDYFKIQEGESWKSYLYRARNNIIEDEVITVEKLNNIETQLGTSKTWLENELITDVKLNNIEDCLVNL